MPDLEKKPWSDLLTVTFEVVVPIVIILIVGVIAMRLVHVFVNRAIKALFDREASEGTARELAAVEVAKRIDTLDDLISRVVQAFIAIIVGLMVLGKIGLDIAPAIAGLGVLGIAVGFGSQALVRDYLNGALILIENQYGKGDIVRIAGVAGAVEDFNLRRTTLRDLSGIVHTIPNGEITVSSNMTRIWSRVNEDVSVAYGTDIDRAIEVVAEVGQAMSADPDWDSRILEAPIVLRVNELGDSGVTLKIVASTRAAEQWAVAGELRKRLLVAFAANGIEIPYPHRVMLSRTEPAAASDLDATSDPGMTDPGDA